MSMNEFEKQTWNCFVSLIQTFLGNRKSENYLQLVNDILSHLKHVGCNMSIKLYYLNSHLDRFHETLGDYSEEQGERFHQDIRTMEERYQGRWDIHMMPDYC